MAAVAGAVLSVPFLVATRRSVRRRRIASSGFHLVTGLLMLATSALLGTLGFSVQGYRALTHEVLAATADVQPVGSRRFQATVTFPDGRRVQHDIAGDQLLVDAQILKWKPWANMLGLHTAYQLARVGGRYVRVEDERRLPHTVFPLSRPARLGLDLFDLRHRYAPLASVVDAEYGSGTFAPADRRARYDILVSTSGLLIRPSDGRER